MLSQSRRAAALVLSVATLSACDVTPNAPVSTPTEKIETTSSALARSALDPTNKTYVEYTQTHDKSVTTWNEAPCPDGVRDVQVAAKVLILDTADVNQVRALLHERKDVRSATFYVEQLILRAPLVLPATDVRIFAKEVRFEDPNGLVSFIDTTPGFKAGRPGETLHGAHGLKAGDVHLRAQTFFSNGNRTGRFVMRGGRGQDGGLGKPGDSKPAIELFANRDNALFRYGQRYGLASGSRRVQPPHGSLRTLEWIPAEISLQELEQNTITISASSSEPIPGLPEDGSDAQAGGRPGNGGDGGRFFTNLSGLSGFSTRNGGVAGERAPVARGGVGGSPRNAIQLLSATRSTQRVFPPHQGELMEQRLVVKVKARKTVRDGRDASAPEPSRPVGNTGTLATSGGSSAWLHPNAVELGIRFAEDLYLNEQNAEAELELTNLHAAIERLTSGPDFAALSREDQTHILQQDLRIQGLLNRLAGNEDYFGNPPHWVPALSLETNKLLFEQEVAWAIRAIFASEWLTAENNAAKDNLQAAIEAQKLLHHEIADLEGEFDGAMARIPALKQEATDVQAASTGFISKLQTVQDQLQRDAKDNVEDRKKLPFWKKGLRALAAVARSIPVGQPVLGGIGQSLDLVLNYNSDEPFETLMAVPDVVGRFSESKVDEKAKEAKDKKTEKDLKNDKNKESLKQKLKELSAFVKPVVEELKKQKELFATAEVKDEEVKAELLKLQGESPRFKELTAEVERLAARRQELAKSLDEVVTTLEETTTRINDAYLEIADLLPTDDAKLILSQKAELALHAMRERAVDRMLKYQYWFKRAYEYRMLRPYPGDLTLANTFEEMAQLALANGQNGVLNGSDFERLFNLYRDELSDVVNDIAQEYNDNAAPQTITVEYRLGADELAALNEQRPLAINLWEKGLFRADHEDVRLIDVQVASLTPQISGGSSSFGYMDIGVAHDGLSRIFRNGEVHVFQHYSKRTARPLAWGVRYENGTLTNHELSASASSLLHSLLEDDDVDLMLYSRPSAWGDLNLTRVVHSDGNLDIKVRELALRVRYDYVQAASAGGFAARKSGQESAIGGRFGALLGRTPRTAELTQNRLLLDLGYTPADLDEPISFINQDEVLAARFVSLHQSARGQAPSDDVKHWGKNQLLDEREPAEIFSYLQTIEEVMLDLYGRAPHFDELVEYTRILDDGITDP